MRGIQKETSRWSRNRNQYLYLTSIGPGCCTTVTQVGNIWGAFKKETSRRSRNRNQYLYVTSIGPRCCPTVTQGGYIWVAFKKKRAGGLGTETSTCISEVLALAVEGGTCPTAVNGCLVKFRGCVMNQFRTYCLTSSFEVIRLPLRAFLGEQKWRNWRERALDCMKGDLPLEFLQEC